MTAAAVTIQRLRAAPHRASGPGRQGLQRALAGIHLESHGLPPQAVVLVRRLRAPAAALEDAARPALQAPRPTDLRAHVQTVLRSALRPAHESAVGAGVAAVWFADEAEVLACLARDDLGASLGQRWWWPLLLGDTPTPERVLQRWLAAPRALPWALQLLQPAGLAAAWLAGLGPAGRAAVLHALAGAYPVGEAVLHALRAAEQARGPVAGAADLPAWGGEPARRGLRIRGPAGGPGAAVEGLLHLAAMLRSAPLLAAPRGGAAGAPRWMPARQVSPGPSGGDRARPGAADSSGPVALGPDAASVPAAGLAGSLQAASGHGAPPPAAAAWQGAPGAGPAPTPACPTVFPAGPATRLPARPGALPTSSGWRAPASAAAHPGAAAAHVPAGQAAAATERPAEPAPAHTPAGAVAGALTPEPCAPVRSPPAVPTTRGPDVRPAGAAPAPMAVFHTDWGGVFFLLNLALRAGLYGDFSQPRQPGLAVSPWRLLGCALQDAAGPAARADPLAAWLHAQAGPAPRAAPGWQLPPAALQALPADARPWVAVDRGGCWQLWHPAGGCVAWGLEAAALQALLPQLPGPPRCLRTAARRTAPERPAAPRLAGLAWPGLRQQLARCLGLPARAALALCLPQPAQLRRRHERLDLHYRLAGHPLPLRLAGLDRDPGWLPAAGCDIRFHFD